MTVGGFSLLGVFLCFFPAGVCSYNFYSGSELSGSGAGFLLYYYA